MKWRAIIEELTKTEAHNVLKDKLQLEGQTESCTGLCERKQHVSKDASGVFHRQPPKPSLVRRWTQPCSATTEPGQKQALVLLPLLSSHGLCPLQTFGPGTFVPVPRSISTALIASSCMQTLLHGICSIPWNVFGLAPGVSW